MNLNIALSLVVLCIKRTQCICLETLSNGKQLALSVAGVNVKEEGWL